MNQHIISTLFPSSLPRARPFLCERRVYGGARRFTRTYAALTFQSFPVATLGGGGGGGGGRQTRLEAPPLLKYPASHLAYPPCTSRTELGGEVPSWKKNIGTVNQAVKVGSYESLRAPTPDINKAGPWETPEDSREGGHRREEGRRGGGSGWCSVSKSKFSILWKLS